MAIFIFTLDVLRVFTKDEKSLVFMDYAIILQSVKILCFAQSPRCLNIYTANFLITLIFCQLGNMLHSDAYCHDTYGKLLHLREKYDKSTVHSTEQ